MTTATLETAKITNRETTSTGRPRLTAVAAILLTASLFAAAVLGPPRYDPNTSAFAAMIDKHQRLHNLASPKVIVVGGSNAALGIDSDLISKRLQRPVVNMGFGVILGLRYMLEEVKQEIKRGDIVVVAPEYDFFCKTKNTESNAQLNGSSGLLQLLTVYPAAIQWVAPVYCSSLDRVTDLLYDTRQLLSVKYQWYHKVLDRLLDKDPDKSLKRLLQTGRGEFDYRDMYNQEGDFVGHLMKPAPGFGAIEVVCYTKYVFNDETKAVLLDFAKFAHKRGASVVVLPPPLPQKIYGKFSDRTNDIFAKLQNCADLNVPSKPSKYVFADNCFFDTPYHLIATARERRSQMLADDVAKSLSLDKR